MIDLKCPEHASYKGISKPRADCNVCREIYKLRMLEEKNEFLEKQLAIFEHEEVINVHKYFGRRIRFGIVSDNHLGSYYENIEVLRLAYKIFQREGIRRVYNAGDILDGEKMYRGQEYEIHSHGAGRQVEYACKVYPKADNITTYFITGNHDMSYWKQVGLDVGTEIARKRKDMIYLGQEHADVVLKNKSCSIKLRLEHPGKGTAYALSYHSQKYVESLSGGDKPNIVVIGHYHKAEVIPNYRNVCVIQAGTTQSQTPYMRRGNIAAMLGFYIVELIIDEKGLIRNRIEFFPQYK